MTAKWSASFCFLILAGAASSTFADTDAGASTSKGERFLNAKHRISAGMAQQDMDAGIRSTIDGFDPIVVKLDELGVDDSDNSYYVDYRYRFNPRWSMLAGAYSFAGSGSRTAERDFNYDGVDYTAGAEIRADFDIDAYLLDVMYSVHRGERSEILVGAGIHALDMAASLRGTLTVDDQQAQTSQSGTTLLAPVPNLRFAATWLATDRIVLTATAGWLSANVDDYEGSFVYAHLRGVFAVTENVGIALGYQRTDIDITQIRARSELNYDVRLDGPTLTLTYAF